MPMTDDFQLKSDLIYLNHAAVSPWPQCTRQAVVDFATENAREGATHYPQWMHTEASLRERLARLINAPSPDDIALVKSTSEGLSFIAFGLKWQAGDNVTIFREEFPSNRWLWESLADRGVNVHEAGLQDDLDPEDSLFSLCDAHTRLISVSSLQFASGLRLDLSRIGEFCRSRGILFCVDGIQSIGALPMDVQACGADFVVADGHKWMLGPEGIGLFYCRQPLRERLMLHEIGWRMVENAGDFDQPTWRPAASARRFECGSPNMLGIHALNTSVGLLLERGMEWIEKQVLVRSRWLMDAIDRIPELERINSNQSGRYGGIVIFRSKQEAGDALYRRLMAAGVICAHRGGGIRFSPHYYTPIGQLEQALLIAADYR